MILAFDLGNSRCKWALLASSQRFQLIKKSSWENQDFEGNYWQQQLLALKSAIEDGQAEPLQAIIASCVANDEAKTALQAQCLQVFGLEVIFASSQKTYHSPSKNKATSRTLTNCYEKELTLGVDRWLAMISQFEHSTGAFLVFDLGTAMTLDLVDGQGKHCGGQIVPGSMLMQSSLLGNTGKIAWGAQQKVEPSEAQLLASNTLDAIEQGALSATAGYCNFMIKRLKSQYKLETIVFTGGGSQSVLDLLELNDGLTQNSAQSANFEYREDLVLEGLFYCYKSQ